MKPLGMFLGTILGFPSFSLSPSTPQTLIATTCQPLPRCRGDQPSPWQPGWSVWLSDGGGGGVIRQEGEIRELISPSVDKRVAGLCQWNLLHCRETRNTGPVIWVSIGTDQNTQEAAAVILPKLRSNGNKSVLTYCVQSIITITGAQMGQNMPHLLIFLVSY